MNIIDLFCGCGGLSEGFEEAGFNIISANDVDKNMIKSYKINHPNTKTILENINNLSAEDFLVKKNKKDIDIIIGGPPCQGFSTVGKRRKKDPRNLLFYQYLRILKEIKPKMFVMENVPGLLTMGRGMIKNIMKKHFEKLGYNVVINILKAENFWVPQRRRRIFFVGNLFHKPFEFPKQTNGKINTVWDAIGDLPKLEVGESSTKYEKEPITCFQKYLRGKETQLSYHKASNHSEIMIERMKHIKQGENHSNLPQHLRLNSGYPNIYGRLIANEPANTITGNCGCVSAPGRFIHPFQNRGITIREAARLQSFKDNRKFFGSQNIKYKQVGNAVPPLLARALALKVKEFFEINL